jgi:hypothetical protein
MGNIQFLQTTPTELADLITASVKRELTTLSARLNSQTTESDKPHLTRQETAAFFDVSVQCIHDWTNKGILKPYKVGNRTYYLRSECMEVMLNKKAV